jgi:hypothetical protein
MKQAIITASLALAGTAGAQTIIYDTFNENDQADLFDCCAYMSINPKTNIEVPFIAAVSGRVSEIDLALFHVAGTGDDAKVFIRGADGKLLHRFVLTGLGSEDQCCQFATVEADGPLLEGGQTYTLEVHGTLESKSGWNSNTAGISGVFYRNGKQGNGTLPAVRIIAK